MATVSKRAAAQAAWRRLVDHLEGIRKSSGAELLAYPQPATECDLHYRDLLERRRDVNAELSALRDDPPPDTPDAAWRARLIDRLTASAFADDVLRAEVARLLAEEDAPI
ncbi:MAG: hypothetical protein OEO83_11535 [Alphaproteobacteria bacterium]|nr:hypothetical protein [Alphaproteobacteria bacterium]